VQFGECLVNPKVKRQAGGEGIFKLISDKYCNSTTESIFLWKILSNRQFSKVSLNITLL